MTHDQIGHIIGIDAKTLRKHFSKELAEGTPKMLAQVANSLFQQAVGRPAKYDAKDRLIQSEIKPYAAAGMFLMKTRGGWSERGPRSPLPDDLSPDDLAKATPEELEVLERFLTKRLEARARAGG